VLVCRGCCCGTAAKHPSFDHAEQVDQLRAAAAGARLWTVDCLGPCERSNVVVVRSGSDRHWFGAVLGPSATATVGAWVGGGATLPVPMSLRALEFDPQASVPFVVEEVAGHDVMAVLVPAFERGLATLTAGSHGATAELPAGPDHEINLEGGRHLRLRQPGGAMALDLGHPGLRVFGLRAGAGPTGIYAMVVLAAVPDPEASEGVVRRLGRDVDALDAADRHDVLYDLGIGHGAARFCVRSSSADLAALLGAAAGRAGLDVVTELGPAIAALSPARVVTTAFGRVEITAPIPDPGGASPAGPHTHVMPELVALGLPGPPELLVPDGLLPAAIVHLAAEAD
jgi:hypothetical protein